MRLERCWAFRACRLACTDDLPPGLEAPDAGLPLPLPLALPLAAPSVDALTGLGLRASGEKVGAWPPLLVGLPRGWRLRHVGVLLEPGGGSGGAAARDKRRRPSTGTRSNSSKADGGGLAFGCVAPRAARSHVSYSPLPM